MKLIKPKPLQSGDTIGLLSVSGVLNDVKLAELEHAVKYFENKGFKVVVSETSYKQHNYFSGTDTERVEAIENFFSNPKIDAIVATRGGYGALRILDKINYELIAKNPKIFVGYSDITALLLMIYKKTGLITYHGAMACADFGAEIVEFTEQSFFKTLSTDAAEITLEKDFTTHNPKNVSGILWGGNLATIASMVGLDFLPNEDLILFVEDVNEPTYKIDRMMTQLFNLGKFRERVKGIILGDFTSIDNKAWFDDFWQQFAASHNMPVCSGLPVGHENKKLTIPLGFLAQCNMYEGKLYFN